MEQAPKTSEIFPDVVDLSVFNDKELIKAIIIPTETMALQQPIRNVDNIILALTAKIRQLIEDKYWLEKDVEQCRKSAIDRGMREWQ